ncbi:hypothetical protein A3K64_02545 [Candidatus Micrarchaeota archaeon RBG_16_36_9]|nr:MAG: hypothetical protein A3K64_02545 [Candidatus Micrarchaeota archaeon RBG_16_36_9]
MNWKRIIIAGVVFAIVSQILRTVESYATLNYYMDPDYFGVWSKVMMPTAGPPPAEFFYVSVASAVIIGIIYAAVYALFNKNLTSKTIFRKGLEYGLILFFMVQIPSLLGMYLLINLPTMLIVYWGISGLVISLVVGIIFAKIIK